MLKATTEEQQAYIDALLKKEDIYHSLYEDYDEDKDEFMDYCSSIYIDGDISFDTLAEIVDYLRACNPEKK